MWNRPIGLHLNKSPSLLDLVSNDTATAAAPPAPPAPPAAAAAAAGALFSASAAASSSASSDKHKASYILAMLIRVGNWQSFAMQAEGVVAKCYYAKRRLVWEVLEGSPGGSFKRKMEVPWVDVTSLQAIFSDSGNDPGMLVVDVSRPPSFFIESGPGKQRTSWQPTHDFTGGQATECRRHVLQFEGGVLNRQFDRLVSGFDERLRSVCRVVPYSEVLPQPSPDYTTMASARFPAAASELPCILETTDEDEAEDSLSWQGDMVPSSVSWNQQNCSAEVWTDLEMADNNSSIPRTCSAEDLPRAASVSSFLVDWIFD